MKDARVHDNNNVEILDENNEITIFFCENVYLYNVHVNV